MTRGLCVLSVYGIGLAALLAGACGSDSSDDATDAASSAADAATSADAGTVADAGDGSDAVASADAAPAGWAVPACAAVSGSPAVTFTLDEGQTLAPAPAISGVVYTAGLVALDTPNVLLAASGGQILRSTDAGCTWASLDTVPAAYMILVANGGDVAYGFSDNDSVLVRIEGTTVTTLTAPASNIIGLGIDPNDPDHIRVGASNGQLYDSPNAGSLWMGLGVPVPGATLSYRVAFDPADIDHVLHGAASIGVSTSTNAGSSWTAATGLASDGSGANAFSIVVSPADGQLVWAEAMDLGPTERRIYRSTDGGLTFTGVVTESADFNLTNGALMAPHPADQDVLYVEFGTYFQGYGTDIYRYDHGTMQVTTTHNDNDSVSSIAFNPADPGVMYLGRTSEDIMFGVGR